MSRSATHWRFSTVGLAVILLLGAVAAGGAAGVAAQSADYDPSNPYVGMTVTATDNEIQDGEFYDLRVVDEFDGGSVSTHSFVEELQADGTEIRIETDSLDPDENYFITGPGLDSPGDLTEAQTFELREQTLHAGFGDDDAVDDSDATNDSDSVDHNDSTDHNESTTTDTEPARYYGTVTINSEPAPTGTTIEAEVDGEVRGEHTIEIDGLYGESNTTDEQLAVTGAPAKENMTVSFILTPPDGDRLAADQTASWQQGTTTELNLSVDNTSPPDVDGSNDSNDTEDSDDGDTDAAELATEPADETNETTDTKDDTTITDTAPGFGIVLAVGSLLGIALLSRRQTS